MAGATDLGRFGISACDLQSQAAPGVRLLMYIGRVAGTVVATIKHRMFDGRALLLVERLELDGGTGAKYDIAVDNAQAGVGDRVLVLDEGTGARQVLGVEPWGPVRAVVVGIIDEIDLC